MWQDRPSWRFSGSYPRTVLIPTRSKQETMGESHSSKNEKLPRLKTGQAPSLPRCTKLLFQQPVQPLREIVRAESESFRSLLEVLPLTGAKHFDPHDRMNFPDGDSSLSNLVAMIRV